MQDNLEKVRTEIEEYLRANRFIVFRGQARNVEDSRMVFWDVDQFPSYLDFLKTAEETGIRLLVMHAERFDERAIDDLEVALEALSLPRDERRPIEKRIEALNPYIGKTSEIEMSFAFDNQVYVYSVAADWHADYEDLYEELMLMPPEFEDAEDDAPMGGFFSKN